MSELTDEAYDRACAARGLALDSRGARRYPPMTAGEQREYSRWGSPTPAAVWALRAPLPRPDADPYWGIVPFPLPCPPALEESTPRGMGSHTLSRRR